MWSGTPWNVKCGRLAGYEVAEALQSPIGSGLLRMPLPKLSEKGSERVFEGGFGRYEDAEMGPKKPSRRSVELRHGCSQGLSDSFSRLDFSDLEAKGVGYARHRNPPKKR